MAAEAARKSWRRNQIKKNKEKKTPNLSHLRAKKKQAGCFARGTGGFPPNPPSAPLIVSFPSKAAARDCFNADGKWLSLFREKK